MKISTIVPAFNEEKCLGETLAQIKSAMGVLTQSGWETELIVCDNNSIDRTAEIARAAGATVVSEPVNQVSRARNSGAAAATGDWLVFVDADSHPSPELFADMAKEIQSGNCIAGGAIIRWDQKHFVSDIVTSVANVGFRWRRILYGAFIFVETAVFRELGGFSYEAFAGEDVELSGRLKALSRETGKRFVILHRHPIITSARRLKDFPALSPLKLVAHIILHPHACTTSREAARRWYDGRR
ncbi:MAG TPA: glycosyltransferase [Verrucomicrobiae bacterium]|nr:glycosyltransferase [Verrucomicrobiae bacterium]